MEQLDLPDSWGRGNDELTIRNSSNATIMNQAFSKGSSRNMTINRDSDPFNDEDTKMVKGNSLDFSSSNN